MMATTATTATPRKALSVDSQALHRMRSFPVEGGEATNNVVSLEAYLRESLPVELGRVAEEVIGQMAGEGLLAGIEVLYHLAEETVQVDLPRRPFEQVVELLVAASAQAMQGVAGKPHVLRVIIEAADAFGDYGPRLRLQDTGEAVSAATLEAVAERVEKLGAKLTVKNRPSGGNIFVVELPPEELASW
ncbi:HAMP domain-containing histidine kinase [Stigmatella erecta]|nr:HAMP domain-containing histidine kinase [Stigmatella erecta]